MRQSRTRRLAGNGCSGSGKLVAAILLTACTAAGGDGPSGFSVTDSAGVEIVRNGATGALPPAALDSSVRVLRIGAIDGPPELQFFRVSAMAIDDENNIYVVDAGHAEVRVFDAAGTFLRRFGRRGRGPGEFEFPSGIWAHGDTVFVADTRLIRMSIFDRTGRDAGTIPLGGVRAGRVFPVRPVPGGWIALPWEVPAGFPYEHGVVRNDTSRIVWTASLEELVALDARAPAAVAPAATAVRELVTMVSGRRVGNQTPIFMSSFAPLFEPEPRYAVDGRGRVYFSTSADYVIDVYDTSGTHVRRLTRAYSPIPITDALIGRFADLARAHWDTASMQGEAAAGKANDEARIRTATVPALPPIGRMLASAEGTLWVERRDLVPDPVALEWTRGPNEPYATKWDVFDPEGRFLGTVTLPPTFSPRVVGESWALGIERDELDVEHVARYEIRR